jgi:signal transduction histidine kinase
MFLLGLLFVIVLKVHTRDLLVSEAHEKANLITAHAEAIQSYVRSTLRPAVAGLIGADGFVIEAMSTSFATRHILSTLNIDKSSFKFRRVATSARNPDYEATEDERKILSHFKESPTLTRFEQIVGKGEDEHLIIARPVYFTQDCMHCHGAPEHAPAMLLKMYGNERGFWRSNGELAGMDIISVSMRNTSNAVQKSVIVFSTWFGIGMVILFGVVQGFFNRLVVHNLRRVGEMLQDLFFKEKEGKKDGVDSGAAKSLVRKGFSPPEASDDIEGMVRAIEVVATHLADARQQLHDYARNLESMVQERTADLAAVASARHADVQLFITLLGGVNTSQEKHGLLSASLELIAGHFKASMAVYVCGVSDLDFTVWPPCAKTSILGAEMSRRLSDPGSLLTLEEPELHDTHWFLPVQSSGNTRGVLGLFWTENESTLSQRPSLALAFSRQLGIALDNLDSLDTLLRQNALLDSLVEGVPDPLILVEDEKYPILANSSAGTLAETLYANRENAPEEAEEALAGRHDIALLLEKLGAGAFLTMARVRGKPVRDEISLDNERSFALAVYPLQGKGANFRRGIVHISETTKEKQLLLQMRRSEKLAAVGQLAAGLAHEINNPLGVIRCYAELLGTSAIGEQEAEDIKTILHHVDRAQSVLKDLLDFARPRVSDIGTCDLLEFIPSMLELFKAKADRAKAKLFLDLPQRLPVIQTDRGMLEQILINLLLNALDAVPAAEGIITLGAREHENLVSISVTDNGLGIHETATVKIFDPFFTTKNSGTGLGLSVAFGMAREMGGTIEAHNNYTHGRRRGVTFSLILPVCGPHKHEVLHEGTSAAHPHS